MGQVHRLQEVSHSFNHNNAKINSLTGKLITFCIGMRIRIL